MSPQPWLERTEPDTTLRKVVYRLAQPVTYQVFDPVADEYGQEQATEFVVVSWGREDDTAIFPALPDGSILSFRHLWSDPYLVEHDEALRLWARERH